MCMQQRCAARMLNHAGGTLYLLHMKTRAELAYALGVTDTRLCLILYRRRQRENYRTFEIPKRAGGARSISAPPRELLWLQRQACKFAKFHSRRHYVANFDLEDFFPSIHFGRTRGVFLTSPFDFGDEA